MFAICIEASHSKGMGHLFRMLNFAKYLKKQKEDFIFLINNNDKTNNILQDSNISYEVVDLNDITSNWESSIIKKYSIRYWINDRLNTTKQHSLYTKNQDIKLITFDDLGDGAKNSDINICGLFFNNDNLKGKKILKGVEYLILNNEIDKYKKERTEIKNILVTLGGSDTYGVTIKVLKLLKKYNIKATIHTGISFEHNKELEKELTKEYHYITYVSSFIEEFNKYDLAITGGGVTPFEANASGLPCLIVANELFEIPNGEFLDSINSSKFIGYYNNIDESIFNDLSKLDINSMSKNGMKNLNTQAIKKIYKDIKSYE
jgi:spore coat polysaccharide biosynthesis predicted glycosyltransferase SpsG